MAAGTHSNQLAILTAELKQAISQKDLIDLSISTEGPVETDELIKRLVTIANTVASETKTSIPYWSNFHSWEHFKDFESEGPESHDSASALIGSMLPFGNCLTMASTVATAWANALLASEDPEIQQYADRVELATDNWGQEARSARDYHVIAMLRLRSFRITIDLVRHYDFVELITLSTQENWVECAPSDNDNGAVDYRAVYIDIGDARLLVYMHRETQSHSELQSPDSQVGVLFHDPFRSIKGGLRGGIRNLGKPSVQYTGLPSRRMIQVCVQWPQRGRPRKDGSGKPWTHMGDLKIDFRDQSISMSGSNLNGWLLRPKNHELLGRLRASPCFSTTGSSEYSTASFSVPIRPDERSKLPEADKENFLMLQELCLAFSVPVIEVVRIVKLVIKEVRLDAQKRAARNSPTRDLHMSDS